MIIIQFRKNLLHYRLAEKNSLSTYPEFLTVLIYSSHLTVIQIDDLPMATHQRLLLLLEVLRIYA